MLEPGQDEDLRLPAIAEKSGPLYEHCTRALERGLRLGTHGLPLIGSGDWNDGMNRVGVKNQGESVWLAWFLIDCLRSFAQIADTRNDKPRSIRYREQADQLAAAVEKYGWDGAWYLRAFFDDGTPLGSAENRECQIDSIAQSWAVISGAADPRRARKAMESVLDLLIRREEGLILLLTPPFDDGPVDPGYIKGYLPGVRENGAQYTHAATWVVQATALLGAGRRLRAFPDPQSDRTCPEPERGAPLQGRALRCGRRCGQPATTRGSGGMVMVHRLSRLALPRGA